MKKIIQPEDIKIVALAAAFEKEDFNQLILAADTVGNIVVTSGPAAGSLVAYQTIAVTAENQGINVQVDLEGADKFVKIVGAGDTGVMAGKAYVEKVRGLDEPVPAVINPADHTR